MCTLGYYVIQSLVWIARINVSYNNYWSYGYHCRSLKRVCKGWSKQLQKIAKKLLQKNLSLNACRVLLARFVNYLLFFGHYRLFPSQKSRFTALHSTKNIFWCMRATFPWFPWKKRSRGWGFLRKHPLLKPLVPPNLTVEFALELDTLEHILLLQGWTQWTLSITTPPNLMRMARSVAPIGAINAGWILNTKILNLNSEDN